MRDMMWRIIGSGALLWGAIAVGTGASVGGAVAGLMGGAIAPMLGCIGCGAAGLMAVWGGYTLAAFLWTQTAFAATTACIGVCAAALAF